MTMHTQGKWGFAKAERIYDKGYIHINTVDKDGSVTSDLICIVKRVSGDDFVNAKRIVQTYNSHEGLLRACKYTLKTIDNPDTKFASFDDSAIKSIIKLEQAIAQAEE